jgi:hypothetical protein
MFFLFCSKGEVITLKDIIKELANSDVFSECQSKYKFGKKNANRSFMAVGLSLVFGRCVCVCVRACRHLCADGLCIQAARG